LKRHPYRVAFFYAYRYQDGLTREKDLSANRELLLEILGIVNYINVAIKKLTLNYTKNYKVIIKNLYIYCFYLKGVLYV